MLLLAFPSAARDDLVVIKARSRHQFELGFGGLAMYLSPWENSRHAPVLRRFRMHVRLERWLMRAPLVYVVAKKCAGRARLT